LYIGFVFSLRGSLFQDHRGHMRFEKGMKEAIHCSPLLPPRPPICFHSVLHRLIQLLISTMRLSLLAISSLCYISAVSAFAPQRRFVTARATTTKTTTTTLQSQVENVTTTTSDDGAWIADSFVYRNNNHNNNNNNNNNSFSSLGQLCDWPETRIGV
jgi:hypothetical protein